MLFLILSISSSETPQGPSGRPENSLFSENCSGPINVSEPCGGEGGLGGSLQVDAQTTQSKNKNRKKFVTVKNMKSKILDNFGGRGAGRA